MWDTFFEIRDPKGIFYLIFLKGSAELDTIVFVGNRLDYCLSAEPPIICLCLTSRTEGLIELFGREHESKFIITSGEL